MTREEKEEIQAIVNTLKQWVDNSVEQEREQIVEKACKWLKRNTILAETTIERFKQAMRHDAHEKQNEQKPFDYENANLKQRDFAPKEETNSWNEEDDSFVQDLTDYFNIDNALQHREGAVILWLKSLKERFKNGSY